MSQARILILTVPHGAAHQRLGLTLKKCLACARPDVPVRVINVLDHCSRWFRTYYNSYQIPLKYWPSLWQRIEGYQHTHTASGPGWLYRRAAKPLERLIRELCPEVVVATEVGMCELAAWVKRQDAPGFRLAAVPTGIDTDRPWVQPEVDLYVAEPRQVAPFLQAQGVPHRKVLACGVPVDPAFGPRADRDAVRKKLGLDAHLPVLLVLFGGAGMGKPLRMIAGLQNLQSSVQTVWIAGRNASLRQQIEQNLARHNHTRVLGWTDVMAEWMAAADLLLGKPGSGTLLETINSGLPILAFDPLPGIERRHCDLIEEWRIGRWIKHPEEIAETIDGLLGHPEKLREFRANALKLARPGAAQRAAEAILSLLSG